MTIGVFFGSQSPEHEVSIITGLVIISELLDLGHSVVAIYITKNREWLVQKLESNSQNKIENSKSNLDNSKNSRIQKLRTGLLSLKTFENLDNEDWIDKSWQNWNLNLTNKQNKLILNKKSFWKNEEITIDVAIPALHGSFGEDGRIQGMLEMSGVPLVGCSVTSSAIGMDKILTKIVAQNAGITTAKFVFATKLEIKNWQKNSQIEDNNKTKQKNQNLANFWNDSNDEKIENSKNSLTNSADAVLSSISNSEKTLNSENNLNKVKNETTAVENNFGEGNFGNFETKSNLELIETKEETERKNDEQIDQKIENSVQKLDSHNPNSENLGTQNLVSSVEIFTKNNSDSQKKSQIATLTLTYSKDEFVQKVEKELGYPVFVKPPTLGSSIGITKAQNRTELSDAIDVCLHYDYQILVETAVVNLADLTCCVIQKSSKMSLNPQTPNLNSKNDENSKNSSQNTNLEKNPHSNKNSLQNSSQVFPNLQASLVQESNFTKEMFSFEDKYLTEGGSQTGQNQKALQIPAQIPAKTTAQIQGFSQILFDKLGCSGIARFDFLLDRISGELYFSEVNILPGNLYKHLWQESGLNFDELLTNLIQVALDNSENQKNLTYNFNSNLIQIANSSKMGSKSKMGKFGKI